MATQNGTVWIWFQRIIGGRIWINGGEKLAVTKKKYFKKSTARKVAASAPRKPAASTVSIKFGPDMLNTLKNNESPYENHGYNFAVCTAVVDGKCSQLSGIFSCREGFLGAFRELLYNDSKLSDKKVSIMVWVNTGGKANISKFGNMPYPKWISDSVKASLKIINHFEKRNKWIRTRGHRVTHSYDKNNHMYVFEGSRWWMTSPHLLSMFLLLIRLGRRLDVHKIPTRASTDTIIEAMKTLSEGDDAGRSKAADKWVVLLDNRRQIFKGRKDFAANFKATNGRNSDGIQMLTDNNSHDRQTQDKFNTCLKEAGIQVKSRPR